MSEVHQVGEARRELQPNGFDPGADTLEGQTRPQRHKDVQPIPTAGLGIVSYSCLLKYVVEPQRRLPQGIERRRLAGIQIEDSRCDLVLPPRAEKFEIKPLTLEQAYQLLEVARGHRLEALFALALATGMRRGELLALKWQDINFSTGTLQIRRILTRVPSKMPGKGYVESEPKTQKSRRSIVIAPFALDALKQHRIHQLEAN